MAEKVVSVDGREIPASDLVFGFMSNGSGIQANGNYAASPEVFKYTCKTGSQKLHLISVTTFIEDAGNFGSDVYGFDVDLTNGIKMGFYEPDDTVLIESSGNVHTNTDWAALTGNFVLHLFQGSGNKTASVVWSFTEEIPVATLSSGQYHAFTLEDDFTGLVAHTFAIKGYYA